MTGAHRITIVLLAGGAATRLPGKLSLPVGDEPMLVRVYRRLTAGGRPCIVSARWPLDDERLASALDAPVVLDEIADAGPLAGMTASAAAAQTPLVFVAAGDLPGLDATFVDALERAYDVASDVGAPPDAVIPVWQDGKAEPLASLYDANSLASAGRAALDAGTRKVMGALSGLRIVHFRIRPEDEAALVNVNTPADYEAYRKV